MSDAHSTDTVQVLSLRAQGLLLFLRENPDIPISADALRWHCGEGRDKLQRALRELHLAGFLRHGPRQARGRFGPAELVETTARVSDPVMFSEPVSWVYYMRLPSGHIKIGTSYQPHKRAMVLEAVVLALEPGSFLEERLRHQQFAHLNERGPTGETEWFRPETELLTHIDQLRRAADLPRQIWRQALANQQVAPQEEVPAPVSPPPVAPAVDVTCNDATLWGGRGGSSEVVSSGLEVGSTPLFPPSIDEHEFWSNGRATTLRRLRFAGVPDSLLEPSFAARVDALTEGTQVYWDDELVEYEAWWQVQPPSGRRANRQRQFLAWLKKAKSRDQWRARKEAERARQRPYNPR